MERGSNTTPPQNKNIMVAITISYRFLEHRVPYPIIIQSKKSFMPTPVSSARQCLAEKAAAALDEAVAVARRRGHSQTTSLHMVSSLLSLPNPCLREACARIRNNAYPTGVQFRAIELSLSVSLDRMPCSKASTQIDEPPLSNSLMAAIKRSQANQRRQPENYSFYQQQQYSSTVPVVKVELRNLILSILDDPLVSRVFGEAGFRSCDVKMATIRPGSGFHPSHLFGCTSRYKRPIPPMFLCNISSGDNIFDVGSKNFSYPFMGCFSGEENFRRIGEIMLRGKKRNPLLMGVSSCDALWSFLETVERKIEGVLPVGLSGLSVICVGDEVLRFANGDCDEGLLELKFKEVEGLLKNGGGNGVLVSFGELKAFCGDGIEIDGLRYLVGKFVKLMESHGGKVWLIGAAVTYDVYFKFLNIFPSIEEDWDIEVLPITSMKFSVGGSYPRSSLMESFVPLGGFFLMPSDMKGTSTNVTQGAARCNACNEKYEQEVAALSNGVPCASFTQESQSSLPSWLQNASKAKNESLLLNAKITGLQKKWDNICHYYHHKEYSHQFGYQFPRVLGFQVSVEKNESASNDSRNQSNASPTEQGNSSNVISSLSCDLQQSSSVKELSSPQLQPKTNDLSLSSVTSVTTDLGLGTISASTCKEQEKLARQSRFYLSGSFSSNVDNYRHSDVKDPKMLYKALVERVSWQEEAIISITKSITQRETNATGVNRSDIWIYLKGPDMLGKKKLAVAIAEILYGSTESLVCVDLCFRNEMNKLFGKMTNNYELTMRGTVVDYLVEKLSKKPSVIFIEKVDKADLVVQNTLSRALETGRLTDLHGREVSLTNSIFLVTAFLGKESGKYSEEDILRVKGRSIKILIRFDLNDGLMDPMSKECYDVNLINKRKLIGSNQSTDQCGSLELRKRAHKSSNLDLNFPAEGNDTSDPVESESDSSSENSMSWLENSDSQIDQTVVFRPFDFETLAEKLYKLVRECLHEIVGFECGLEIESKVMLQLLAASYLFETKRVEDWIRFVLKQGFVEAKENSSLDAHSVVKLVTSEGSCLDEQMEALLPDRIILN